MIILRTALIILLANFGGLAQGNERSNFAHNPSLEQIKQTIKDNKYVVVLFTEPFANSLYNKHLAPFFYAAQQSTSYDNIAFIHIEGGNPSNREGREYNARIREFFDTSQPLNPFFMCCMVYFKDGKEVIRHSYHQPEDYCHACNQELRPKLANQDYVNQQLDKLIGRQPTVLERIKHGGQFVWKQLIDNETSRLCIALITGYAIHVLAE